MAYILKWPSLSVTKVLEKSLKHTYPSLSFSMSLQLFKDQFWTCFLETSTLVYFWAFNIAKAWATVPNPDVIPILSLSCMALVVFGFLLFYIPGGLRDRFYYILVGFRIPGGIGHKLPYILGFQVVLEFHCNGGFLLSKWSTDFTVFLVSMT